MTHPYKERRENMPTRSLIEPLQMNASDIEKVNTDAQLSLSMRELIEKNQDLYQGVGNREQIESLKL